MTKRKINVCIISLSILLLFCGITVFRSLTSKQETWLQPQDEETFGMLLIDILDQETASFYHVDQLGVYVLAVDENSQAFEMGICSGDCVMEVAGMRISSIADFSQAMMDATSNDRKVEMVVSRGAEENVFTVCFDTDG